jgi:hypothetical protein
MAETKIKAAQFHGVVGHGTDGYFLMTNADGSMSWAQGGASGPSVTSVDYQGDDLAADPNPDTPQSVVLTGTNFGSSMSVTIGGTAATAVAHDSSTQLTVTIPSKPAGDYDIVVTNTVTGASGTFVNGISYNGIPTWTTATGSLGTFESETTISTITLAATEPDGGTITFNITNGALPTGLSLTGANIDGTTTAESSTTLYSFTIEAIDDENQATPRNFSITVNASAIVSSENFTINTYEGNGSTQSIEGKIGTAASFNGQGSYISTSLNSSNIYALSFWLYFESGVTQYTPFGTDVSSGAGDISTELGTNGSFSITIQNKTYSKGAGALGSTGWKHIAYSSDQTLYINGVLQTGGTTPTGSNPSANLLIGSWNNTFPSWGAFNSKLDQIRVFNRNLTSSEVTTLYNEPSNLSTASTTDIFDDGSGVALYEFEKGGIDTGGVNGYIGSAGVFNGSSSAITATGLPSLTTFSLSFWIQATDPNADTWVIQFDDGSNNNANSLFLHNFGTQFGFSSSANTTSFGLSTSDTDALFDNNWHNVVLTVNGSDNANTKMYVDGSEKTLTRDAGSGTATIEMTSTMNIGKRRDNSSTRYLNGSIDQVRIFNKALSSSEVTTLYGETSASATKSTTDIFDDGSGVALYELEGNANDTPKGAIDAGQSGVFNGSSYITSSSNIDYAQSISMWFDVERLSIGQEGLWSQTIDGTTPWAGTSLEWTGSYYQIRMFIRTAGSDYLYQTSGAITVNSGWNHLVFTFDNNTGYSAWLNNSELTMTNSNASGAISSFPAQSGTTAIGTRWGNGSNLKFKGKIDDVRIYSDKLTSQEVGYLYNNATASIPTNYVAHYKLDGNANDVTTNYNATWTGTAAYSDPAEFPTYDGTATNVTYGYDGTPTNVGFVGTSFEPDLVWIKNRDTTEHNILIDVIRQNETGKFLSSNLTNASFNTTQPTFDSNGFTLSGIYNGYLNITNNDYVAWCWKAADTTTTIAANTVGNTIASDVRANQDAGFSIVKYTGSGANATVSHGLSSAPEMVIVKGLTTTYDWVVYHSDYTDATYYQTLNTTSAQNSVPAVWNSTAPSSTNISLGSNLAVNSNNVSHIAYCFHSVDGYQKVGSYSGSSSNVSVVTGFEPRFLLVKRSSGDANWAIFDSVRDTTNPRDLFIRASASNAEESSISNILNFTSNGFEVIIQNAGFNAAGETYIYLAIA